jgi:hypothetical protein
MIKHEETGLIPTEYNFAHVAYNGIMDVCKGDLAKLTARAAWSESNSAPVLLEHPDLVILLGDMRTTDQVWVLHPDHGRLLVSTRQLMPVTHEVDPAGITMCSGGSHQGMIGVSTT